MCLTYFFQFPLKLIKVLQLIFYICWSHDQDLKNPGPSMCLGVMITRKRNHNNVAKKINKKICLDLCELFTLKLYTKIQHRDVLIQKAGKFNTSVITEHDKYLVKLHLNVHQKFQFHQLF